MLNSQLIKFALITVTVLICFSVTRGQEFSETTRSFIKYDDETIALVNVTVIDGTGATAQRNQTVIFSEGTITEVGPVDQVNIHASAKVIDGEGKTIVPGFVMLHEHMFYTTTFEDNFSLGQMSWTFPRLYLAGGATTIRTAGSINPTADLNVKRLIDKGIAPGPDMDVTGPFINSGEPILLDFPDVQGEVGPGDLVNFWADQGCTSFKVYMHITKTDLSEVIAAAHARGLKVTGHLCSVSYEEAAELGIDCLEHGFAMSSDFDPQKQENFCEPFNMSKTLRALGPDAPEMKELMQLLIDKGVAVTSTLPVFEPLRKGNMMPAGGFEALDEHYQNKITAGYNRRSQYESSFDMSYFNKQRVWEKQFYDMGGLLVAGTDPTGSGKVIAGYSNQYVPMLFVEGGFTVEEAINVCTMHGAEYLDRDDEIGSIEVGKQADLVLIDGDLIRDISSVRNMEVVFKDGVGYDSEKLFRSVKGLVGTN